MFKIFPQQEIKSSDKNSVGYAFLNFVSPNDVASVSHSCFFPQTSCWSISSSSTVSQEASGKLSWWVVPAVSCFKYSSSHRPQSDKVAEVSYASQYTTPTSTHANTDRVIIVAMQGRETLIAKFRNSSVMTEPTSSRPKVFDPSKYKPFFDWRW